MKKFLILSIFVVSASLKANAGELANGITYTAPGTNAVVITEKIWKKVDAATFPVDPAGIVGIGTSNPKGRLHIHNPGPEGKLIISGGNNNPDSTRDQNTYSSIYLGNANPNDILENSWIISHHNESFDANRPGKDAFTISRSVGSQGGYSSITPLSIKPNGYVGIGGFADRPLRVENDADDRNDLHTAAFVGANGVGVAVGHYSPIAGNGHVQAFRYKPDASGVNIYDVDLLLNAGGGNVGVGTSNPRAKLTVESKAGKDAAIALNVGAEGAQSKWTILSRADAEHDKNLDFIGNNGEIKMSLRHVGNAADKTILYVNGLAKLQPLTKDEAGPCSGNSGDAHVGRIYVSKELGKPLYCGKINDTYAWRTFDGVPVK